MTFNYESYTYIYYCSVVLITNQTLAVEFLVLLN